MKATALVVAIGETLVRLSTPPGTSLEGSTSLEVRAAGAESNVAIGLARLGVPARWASILPANPLGQLVVSRVRQHGVDVSVGWRDPASARVAVYFIEPGVSPRPTRLVYDRAESAFAQGRLADLPEDTFDRATLVHTTGITLAVNPTLTAEAVAEATRRNVRISFDLNFRSKLWTPDKAREALTPLAGELYAFFATAEEARLVLGLQGSPQELASQAFDQLGAPLTVITDGENGAVCLGEGSVHCAPGHALTLVDRVGAGDAFVAGFLAGLEAKERSGNSIDRALHYGSALAALKHTFYGDVAWCSLEEVQALANRRTGGLWR